MCYIPTRCTVNVLLFLAVVVGSILNRTVTVARAEAPTIVLVNVDDLNLHQAKYLKKSFRELKSQGLKYVNFKNAYSTTPVCCPSRASLFTGQYAHNTQILRNYEYPEGELNGGATGFTGRHLDESTIATWLSQANYSTRLFGKYLNGYENVAPLGYVPPGWSGWWGILDFGNGSYNYSLSKDGRVVNYGQGAADYMTDVLARGVVKAIRETASGTPLFIYFAPFSPHAPAIPADRYKASFPTLKAPRPPSYNEADVSDKPDWVKGLSWTAEKEAESDTLYANGARSLLAVDDAILSIIKELHIFSRLSNTYFFITNDNGYSNGEHRWMGKNCPYESCVKVPLVVASNALTADIENHPHIVANIDLAITIAELAGVTPPAGYNGKSLAPLLSSSTQSVRDELLIENWAKLGDVGTPDTPIPTWSGIVTETMKYIEYTTGEKEFYNLLLDPHELTNAVSNPEYALTVQHLCDRLKELKVE